MVDPSGLGHRMKMKCIVSGCGFEKEVDNGILLKDIAGSRSLVAMGMPGVTSTSQFSGWMSLVPTSVIMAPS
jgi:hypothetical protein